MKKNYLLFFLIFAMTFSTFQAFSQEKCKATIKKQEQLQNPQVAERVAQIEAFTQRWIRDNQHITQRSVVTIPVVVHVLYNTTASNISDAQINSQFVVLNNDFRKTNSNFSSTPAGFQSLAADTEIEFCLATQDENGNPTTGITRTSVPNNFDIESDYFNSTNGGVTPWDNKKYLNIWIGDLGAGLLGFATPPGTANGNDDGAVINYTAWGTTGAVTTPSHLGRTATHEIGHYLNLEHVWGVSGGCNDDDFVTDTPNQDTESGGCPTFPLLDACTASGDGVMFTNYMDYSDDNCMTMFTAGQKARMLAALNGPRVGLLTSLGCAGQANTDNILNIPINISPNPAQNYFTVQAETTENLQVEVINMMGQIIRTDKIQQQQKEIKIETMDWSAGIYFVKISTKHLSKTHKVVIAK